MTESRAIAGERVVVTRARHQAAELVALLEAAGASVARLPLLEIVPPEDTRPLERASTELALFRWLVLTSANGAHALLESAGGALPANLRVAVVGTQTAAALGDYGRKPDLVATDRRAEGLVAELGPRLARRERVLLPQAADARTALAEGLERAGAEVVRVVAYDKRTPADAGTKAAAIFAKGELGWVTFTSPSTVRALAALLGADWELRRSTLRALSIGPVTTGELASHGVLSVAQAHSPSDEDLVRALLTAISEERSDSP